MQGSYKFMSLSTEKKIVRRKLTEMPMTESVMKQINKWAKKDRNQNGLMFLSRNGMEYKFNNDDDQATLVVQPEATPFPDIPAEAPGILTEHEEIHGTSPIKDEPTQSDKERATLVAENSGIEFGPVDAHKRCEVIELLDDNDKDVLNNFIQDNIVIKIERRNSEDLRKIVEEENENEETEPFLTNLGNPVEKGYPTKKMRIANYTSLLLRRMNFSLPPTEKSLKKEGTDGAVMSNEAMSAVAHYIMVHYADKELIKKRKKKYKPKDGQYTLDAGLRKFGNKGKTAVTKELRPFNTHNIFVPLEANSLSNKEKRSIIIAHIP
jgi:hypothetical protein